MIHRAVPAAFLALCAASPAAFAQDAERPIVKKVREIQRDVERMRGLKFRAPVKVGVKKPADLKKMLFEDFDKEEPLEEMRNQEKVLKLFGLVPESFDLRDDLLAFLGEHIGGFYLPEKKELFLVDRSAGGGMMEMQQKMNDPMVMAHELQHALQDQHFGLDRWFDLLADHEDRLQAYKSLTEGEAQLIGMSYMMGDKGKKEVDLKRINQMQEMMLKMMPQQGGNLPPYLMENMMFPYTQGAEFFQELRRKQGWEKIGEHYADPPQSTEQILHPEKYYLDRDDPTEIRLSGGLLRALGGADAKVLYENTLGEFNVSILLRALGVSKGQAAKGAAGWDGDRFGGFKAKAGHTVVVWLSTWDSVAEASEFEGLYRKALATKRPDARLERRGTEVLLVDGATKDETELLVRRGFRAVKVEERWSPLAGLSETPDAVDLAPEAEASAKLAEIGKPSTTGNTASAPTRATLLHNDDVGAAFVLPQGWSAAPDPLELDQRLPSTHYATADGGHLRLFKLPQPIKGNEDLFAELIGKRLNDYKVTEHVQADVYGAYGRRMNFTSTDDQVLYMSSLRAIDMGDQTLVVATSFKDAEGAAARAQANVDDVIRTLWLDENPLGGGRLDTQDGELFKVSVPRVFETLGTPQGLIFHSQSDVAGGKVQIAKSNPVDLASYAARLEAQIPLMQEGAKVLKAGIVKRRGRDVYEIEFETGGRRTHQLVVEAGGQLWNVACSAPSEQFDAYRWQFGQILGEFRVQPGRKYRKAPEAPKQKGERQPY